MRLAACAEFFISLTYRTSDRAPEGLSAADRKRLRRWAEKMRRAKRLFEHRRWEDLSDDDKKTLAWLEERLHTKWVREGADAINAFLGMGAPAGAPPETASRRDSTETIYAESDTGSDAGSHVTVDGGGRRTTRGRRRKTHKSKRRKSNRRKSRHHRSRRRR